MEQAEFGHQRKFRYGKQRTATYGGIKPADYTDWFLPRAAEFQRVLRRAGTFILNIKEHAQAGERRPYVIKLVLALREQGWLWTEEFIWHKKNGYPGKWPNRFRDAWEHCYQFNREKRFYMDQDAVMVPVGDWVHARLKNPSDRDKRVQTSATSGRNISNWKSRNYVYPTNVLHLATECSNKARPADRRMVSAKTVETGLSFAQRLQRAIDVCCWNRSTCCGGIMVEAVPAVAGGAMRESQ